MSSNGKYYYKQFTINNLEDGIISLGSLVVGVVANQKMMKINPRKENLNDRRNICTIFKRKSA